MGTAVDSELSDSRWRLGRHVATTRGEWAVGLVARRLVGRRGGRRRTVAGRVDHVGSAGRQGRPGSVRHEGVDHDGHHDRHQEREQRPGGDFPPSSLLNGHVSPPPKLHSNKV